LNYVKKVISLEKKGNSPERAIKADSVYPLKGESELRRLKSYEISIRHADTPQ
jgi:hypothetical protein